MRTYDVTLAELPEQQIAVVRAHVPFDGLAAFLGGAFGEVAEVLGGAGDEPAGMPVARYRVTADGFDAEAGFPVRHPVTPIGRVESSVLAGGSVARVMHRGAYADVRAAYEAALRWIDANGMQTAGDPWESYLDEPDVAEPRTEVFVPCRRAHR